MKPVPLTDVDILDDFWAPRMEVNRNVSIWHCFKKMEESEDFGSPKLIEGAAYMLAKRPDPQARGIRGSSDRQAGDAADPAPGRS